MSSDSTPSIAAATTSHPSRRSPDVVPRHRTLDRIVAAVSQADGIGLIDVDAFTTLVVRTRNSVYRITILKPHAREVLGPGGQVLPRAHPRLPERVEFRRQLSEDGLGRPRPAHGVSRRRAVDHHVTRARDRGRAVRDRSTLLADVASKRTCAM